jgi:hypothetical protein
MTPASFSEGRRPGRLAGGRVPLRDDGFESLKDVARDMLARFASSRARAYQPTAKLEQGEEHFVVPMGELPVPPGHRPLP